MRAAQAGAVAVVTLVLAACQMISGLDDLKADRKQIDSSDAGPDADAGSGRDAGEASDGGVPAAGSGGRATAGAGGRGAAGGGGSGTGGTAGAPVAGNSGSGGMSGGGGAPAPACKPPVSGGACDPIAQCGCGSAENCVFFSGKLACVAEGTAAPYAGCTEQRNCAKGYQCVGNVCEKSCASAADAVCEGEGARCRQVVDDRMPVSGDYTCTRSCNPAHPQLDDARFDGCAPGVNCSSFGEFSSCVPATTSGTSGKHCTGDGDCAVGLYCSNQSLCEKWCEVGTNDCGAGSTCSAFSTKTYAGKSIEFGGCCTPPAGKGPCDTAPQCGCPTDQRCDIVFGAGQPDGTTACVAIGTVEPFQNCTSQADCGRGFSCSDRSCKVLCDVTRPDSCGFYSEHSTCTSVQVGATDVPGWGVCSELCNPAAPFAEDPRFTACVNGTTCRNLGDGDTDCRRLPDPSTSVGTQGAPCDDGSGGADGLKCAPGHFCDTDSLKCLRYCEIGAADGCTSGLSCFEFTPPTRIPTLAMTTLGLGFCR